MKDRMGREIDYMRFSITDRCNLRCKYCMPEGIDCMPRWAVLSLEEFEAIAIAAASLGIKKIKVTGGEPLARKSCPQLVKMLKNIPGIEKVILWRRRWKSLTPYPQMAIILLQQMNW